MRRLLLGVLGVQFFLIPALCARGEQNNKSQQPSAVGTKEPAKKSVALSPELMEKKKQAYLARKKREMLEKKAAVAARDQRVAAAGQSPKRTRSAVTAAKQASSKQEMASGKELADVTAPEKEKKEYTLRGSEFDIDGVGAVVFGQEGTQLITKAEVERPSLTGQIRPLSDVVFERQVFLDALKHKIAIDDDVIDRYLAVVQRQNNLTAEDMRQVFSNAGYTYEEGREQFKVLQVVNQMFDYKVRSNLIVPRKDVEAYYKANPETAEATYKIEYAEVPFDPQMAGERQTRRIKSAIGDGTCKYKYEWTMPFTLGSSEIAASKSFIREMKPDEYHGPIELDNGYGIYHLVEKTDEHELTLEERYHDIVELLRAPRYEELLNEYRDNLVKSTSVLYL